MNSTSAAKARRIRFRDDPIARIRLMESAIPDRQRWPIARKGDVKRNRLRWLTARPIAHRGFHDLRRGRPENTLAAFDAAVEARYAIECDLHISADGVPVVFHDDELERLTGEPGAVRDRTAAELGDLRVAGTGEWIPTLDELLALVGGRVPLVIELKHVPGRDAGLAVRGGRPAAGAIPGRRR